jgi:hypothetical protein
LDFIGRGKNLMPNADAWSNLFCYI